MKLFVGIDVSSKELEAAILTSDVDDDVLFRGKFANDINGATELKKVILSLQSQRDYQKIVIGMEATSMYSFHPAYFFQNDDDLAQFDTETVVVNPRQTARYKKIYEESKNDRIDAFYIADFLRLGRYSVGIVRHEKYIALQRLTRSRFEVVKSLTRSKQHFLENLYYKLNKLAIGNVETSVFGSTMMTLLTDNLSVDELAEMPLEELSQYLNEKGRGRFAEPARIAKSIQKAVRGSYRLSTVVQDSIDVVLSVYVTEIRTFEKQIKVLEKAIEDLMKTIEESKILQSIPGIGPVYAAGIIAEIGQIERFEDQAKLAKYAGLTWKQNQSGSFDGEITPMTHSGDIYLRYYLIEAANSVKRHEPTFKRFYESKMSDAKRTPHKRAISLTARKLIRVIDALLRNHQIYRREELV